MAGSIVGTPSIQLESSIGREFNVTVEPGLSRAFILAQIFLGDANVPNSGPPTSGQVISHGTLNGVAHDFFHTSYNYVQASQTVAAWRCWAWVEDSLKAAKAPIGDQTVKPYAGLVLDEALPYLPLLHSIWAWATYTEIEQDTSRWYANFGGFTAGTAFLAPTGANLVYDDTEVVERPVFMLASSLLDTSTLTPNVGNTTPRIQGEVTSPDDGEAVARAQHVYLMDASEAIMEGLPTRYSATWNENQSRGHECPILALRSNQEPAQQNAGASTVTLGQRPNTRSIDARTIADAYNRGAALEPDYNFSGRKFYQEPPETP